MPNSLLDLPDELLIEIIALSDHQKPQCENQESEIFQINRRLHRLAFETFASNYMVLRIRTFRTLKEIVDNRDQPMWFFFDERLTVHFKRVPASWKSLFPDNLEVTRLISGIVTFGSRDMAVYVSTILYAQHMV